jgi:hypothetical protein
VVGGQWKYFLLKWFIISVAGHDKTGDYVRAHVMDGAANAGGKCHKSITWKHRREAKSGDLVLNGSRRLKEVCIVDMAADGRITTKRNLKCEVQRI